MAGRHHICDAKPDGAVVGGGEADGDICALTRICVDSNILPFCVSRIVHTPGIVNVGVLKFPSWSQAPE